MMKGFIQINKQLLSIKENESNSLSVKFNIINMRQTYFKMRQEI